MTRSWLASEHGGVGGVCGLVGDCDNSICHLRELEGIYDSLASSIHASRDGDPRAVFYYFHCLSGGVRIARAGHKIWLTEPLVD